MRAGPLSDPEIIELLNARFENVWILAKDVKALAADEGAPADLRAFAAKLASVVAYLHSRTPALRAELMT